MDPIPRALLVLGGLLFLGLLAEGLARRTRLPQVTLLLLLGVMAGPQALDLLSPERDTWFPVAASLALVMIGFLLGGEFTPERLGREARSISIVAGVQALITALVVGGALLLLGFSPQLALPLAGIATATDPATTVSVAREVGAEGPLTRMLLGVVAIDDALALAAFGLLLAAVSITSGNDGGAGALLLMTREIGGAVGIGIAIGLLAALFSGRIRPGEPTLLEALGIVLVCAGLSLWLEVSYPACRGGYRLCDREHSEASFPAFPCHREHRMAVLGRVLSLGRCLT
jgi:NhaP-type Na+/H+ or K+/H+ antiporter